MNKLHSMLMELGADSGLTGFRDAETAIQMMIEDPSLKKNIVRDLLPKAGAKTGRSGIAVERCIRHMLEGMQEDPAWPRRLQTVGAKYHAPGLSGQFIREGRPLNLKKFLIVVADIAGERWNEEAE